MTFSEFRLGKAGRSFLLPSTLAMSFYMERIDASITTSIMPQIASGLNTSLATLSIIISIYFLSYAVFTAASTHISARIGARESFLFALISFGLSSVACGMSQNVLEMALFRAWQGLSAALMIPVGRLILLSELDRSQHIVASRIMTTPAVMGPIIGPVLGGALTELGSWRYTFFVNIPVCAVAFMVASPIIPRRPPESVDRFDHKGFGLNALFMSFLQAWFFLTGQSGITSSGSLIMAFGAAASGYVFLRYLRKAKAPIYDIHLMNIRPLRLGVIGGSLARIGCNGITCILPVIWEIFLSASTRTASLVLVAVSLGALSTKPFGKRAYKAIGLRAVLASSPLIVALSALTISLVEGKSGLSPWCVCLLFLFGFGRAMTLSSSNILGYSEVNASRMRSAVTLLATIQQVSMGLGASVGFLCFQCVESLPWSGEIRAGIVLSLLAVFALASIPVFLRLSRGDGSSVLA